MLLETQLGAEQRELARTIRVSGSILLSTVSNFLDFFKLEAGKPLDVVRREINVQVGAFSLSYVMWSSLLDILWQPARIQDPLACEAMRQHPAAAGLSRNCARCWWRSRCGGCL